MALFLLLLFCTVSSAVKHSLTYLAVGSSGLPNISEFVCVMEVDGINVGYCDSNNTGVEPRQDWMKTMVDEHPDILKWHTQQCFQTMPNFFRVWIRSLKQQFNQDGGVHILQMIEGCEWDENTGPVTGFLRFGYNRENFVEFDMKTKMWIALKPEADVIKQRLDADGSRNDDIHYFLTTICPEWLKKSLSYGKSSLQRTVLPSVSLLQKSPSSPVSCHATGFYPDRAAMFWRKDGEELHEGVDPGEILPNNDGTFQMSVDLNVSSVTAEDWSRYECVFQLCGTEDSIITKLNETGIRTNQKEKSLNMAIPIIVVLVLILLAADGVDVYKKKEKHSALSSGTLTL